MWLFMKPKLLHGGLNKVDKCLGVRNLLKQWNEYIICLQESKIELIFGSVVRCGLVLLSF